MPDVPYRSLYRRYRPKKFSEVRGQDHTTRALRNAVRDGKVAHAYLFSGPRGTGKTSTARILAMALNCENLEDGEPCGRCGPCQEGARGSSLDVHELDAASNNGVEAMRDLVARAALGTPGRWKVYIVDEVHMLSTAASNALLKTLEEPPGHVAFVLATTDPQKVLPTIRSRTQHFEFRLLGPGVLTSLLEDVASDAGLDLPDQALEVAVRKGGGSARDALSQLDQLVAAGFVEDEVAVLDELLEAMCDQDAGRGLKALAEASAAGRSPDRLAADLVERLRQGFLAVIAPELVSLAGADRDRVADQARRLGLPALVRSMEVVGRAQTEMRDSLDPRLGLELAMVRTTRPEADDSAPALLERIERLERRLDERRPLASDLDAGHAPTGGAPASHSSTEHAPARLADTGRPDAGRPGPGGGQDPRSGAVQGPGVSARGGPAAEARAALGAIQSRAARSQPESARPAQAGGEAAVGGRGPAAARDESTSGSRRSGTAARSEQSGSERGRDTAPFAAVASAASADSPVAAAAAGRTSADSPGVTVPREELVKAWGDSVLGTLKGRTRALFRAGRFLGSDAGFATFALPDKTHVSYCEECKSDVEAALSAHFSTELKLHLVVDDNSVAPPPSIPEERPDVLMSPSELGDPVPGVASVEERLLQMFPGAEEI